MGSNQTVQSLVGEEGILPTMIVSSLGASLAFCPLLQDRPQALPHEAVDLVEVGLAAAVLKVGKPATQGPVHSRDDGLQRLPRRPFRFPSQRLFESGVALLANPSLSPFKVIAQKIKAAMASVHESGFRRMQRQPVLRDRNRSRGGTPQGGTEQSIPKSSGNFVINTVQNYHAFKIETSY